MALVGFQSGVNWFQMDFNQLLVIFIRGEIAFGRFQFVVNKHSTATSLTGRLEAALSAMNPLFFAKCHS